MVVGELSMRKKAARPDGNLAVIYARYSSHSQRDVSIDQQVKVIENDRQQATVPADD